MSSREKAEEFFDLIAKRKKTLVEIPLNCSTGETGTLLYLTFVKAKATPSEIATSLEVSMPRILSVVNSLERKALLTKEIDALDKRKKVIKITEKGRKIVLEKKEEAVEKITKIIEKLEEKEVLEYIRISTKIGKIMDKI